MAFNLVSPFCNKITIAPGLIKLELPILIMLRLWVPDLKILCPPITGPRTLDSYRGFPRFKCKDRAKHHKHKATWIKHTTSWWITTSISTKVLHLTAPNNWTPTMQMRITICNLQESDWNHLITLWTLVNNNTNLTPIKCSIICLRQTPGALIDLKCLQAYPGISLRITTLELFKISTPITSSWKTLFPKTINSNFHQMKSKIWTGLSDNSNNLPLNQITIPSPSKRVW
jgi:hypothetical protein